MKEKPPRPGNKVQTGTVAMLAAVSPRVGQFGEVKEVAKEGRKRCVRAFVAIYEGTKTANQMAKLFSELCQSNAERK